MSQKYFLSSKENKYYLEGGYKDDFKRLDDTLDEPRFVISQLGITARDASYWDKQGILPELRGKGSRRKYDLIQSVWIRLIPQMRKLGIGTATIKLLKDSVFDSSTSFEVALKNEAVVEQLKKLMREKLDEDAIEKLLSSESIKNASKNMSFNLFKYGLMMVILFKKNISLLVTEKGYFTLYSLERHNELLTKDPNYKLIINSPHFSISLSDAYAYLVKSWKEEPFFEQITIVSDGELKILNALKEPELKSVTIKFKDGELDLIEKVKENDVDLGSRFMDVICKNGYQTVTIKTRAGKIVNYENRILEKI
ncbi:MAG: hypothetical protein KFKLKKLM_01244 [Flavobacteriales bacterium]|nr:hypothetical protein [Flavobacteriales bacterium]